MKPKRQSFFQRLTGGIRDDDEDAISKMDEVNRRSLDKVESEYGAAWNEEDSEPVASARAGQTLA